MEAHSGHYLPTPENFQALISTLTNSGADLTIAKVFHTAHVEELSHTGVLRPYTPRHFSCSFAESFFTVW